MRGDKARRIFVWRLTEKRDVADLEEFLKKSVFLGRPPADNLAMLVRRFNAETTVGCTLISESDMLADLAKARMGMTRQTLKALRDKRMPDGLDPDTGERLWASDGAGVIYNRQGMRAYVRRSRGVRKKETVNG